MLDIHIQFRIFLFAFRNPFENRLNFGRGRNMLRGGRIERRSESKINFMVGLPEHVPRQVLLFRRCGKLGERLRGAELPQVHGRLREFRCGSSGRNRAGAPFGGHEKAGSCDHEERNQNNKNCALVRLHFAFRFPPRSQIPEGPEGSVAIHRRLCAEPAAQRLPPFGMIANHLDSRRDGDCQDQSDRAPEPSPE